MSTQHTPGPWSTHTNIGRKGELGIVAHAAPCVIATMCNAKQWPVEAEANARLIAAAPELLAEFTRLLAHLEMLAVYGKDKAVCKVMRSLITSDGVRAARAAIAKATREEN